MEDEIGLSDLFSGIIECVDACEEFRANMDRSNFHLCNGEIIFDDDFILRVSLFFLRRKMSECLMVMKYCSDICRSYAEIVVCNNEHELLHTTANCWGRLRLLTILYDCDDKTLKILDELGYFCQMNLEEEISRITRGWGKYKKEIIDDFERLIVRKIFAQRSKFRNETIEKFREEFAKVGFKY